MQKFSLSLSLSLSLLLIFSFFSIAFTACGGGGGNVPAGSDTKELTYFAIVSPDRTGEIDQTAKTVTLHVPFGTDLASLTADFTTTGVAATVNGVEQETGVTENNFTGDVIYRVTAEDGSYSEYTVTVKVWVKTFGGTGDDYAQSMCVDSSGNIYITGYFENTIDFGNGGIISNGDTDIFIAKYSPDRTFQWVRTIGGPGSDKVSSISIDSDDNIYITGMFSDTVDFDISSDQGSVTSMGNEDMFLVKFTSGGIFQWVNTIGGTGIDGGMSVCITNSNDVYVTGSFRGSVDFDGDGGNAAISSNGSEDIFIIKYSSEGVYQSVKTIGGTSPDIPQSISADSAGNIYLTGGFTRTIDFGGISLSGFLVPFDVFVVKYSSTGVCQWAKKIGGTGAGSDSGSFIRTDSSGNVYVTGYFSNTVNFGNGDVTSNGGTDLFIVKYDTNGSYLWANAIGGTGDDDGISLCFDSAGNVYLAGGYNNTVDFDGAGDIGTVVSNGGSDAYIAKFSSEGIFKWVKTIGGTGYDSPGSIVSDSAGNIYLTGIFENSVNFGNTNVISNGGIDFFLVQVIDE